MTEPCMHTESVIILKQEVKMLKEAFVEMKAMLILVHNGVNQLNVTTSNIQGKLETRSIVTKIVGTGIITVVAGVFVFLFTKGA